MGKPSDLRTRMHVHVWNEQLAFPASVLPLTKVRQKMRADEMAGGLPRVMFGLVARPGDRSAGPVSASGDLHDAVAARTSPHTFDGRRIVCCNADGDRSNQGKCGHESSPAEKTDRIGRGMSSENP